MKTGNQIPEGIHFKFFNNSKCEFFPCHDTDRPEEFNCLFCFCPAYALGEHCGGDFSYDNEKGIKDCSGCMKPHEKDSYEWMLKRAAALTEIVRKK